MHPKAPSAGDIIDARCSKCKAVTNHTLIALVGATPVKVQCNTCGGQHNYRAPVIPKTARVASAATKARKPRSPKKDPQAEARLEWEQKASGFDPGKAVPYAMDSRFKVGQQVNHPTFGPGLVKNLSGSRKVEILFKEGVKVLRCR